MIRYELTSLKENLNFIPTDIGHYEFFFYNGEKASLDATCDSIMVENNKTTWTFYTHIMDSKLIQVLAKGSKVMKVKRLTGVRNINSSLEKNSELLEETTNPPSIKIEWDSNSGMEASRGYSRQYKITIKF